MYNINEKNTINVKIYGLKLNLYKNFR